MRAPVFLTPGYMTYRDKYGRLVTINTKLNSPKYLKITPKQSNEREDSDHGKDQE